MAALQQRHAVVEAMKKIGSKSDDFYEAGSTLQAEILGFARQVGECRQALAEYLREGVLVEQFVLEHINPLLDCLRKCNTTLRWQLTPRQRGGWRSKRGGRRG